MKALVTLAAVICAGVMPAAAVASPTTISPLRSQTTVSAFAGVQAWSDYDATTKLWHVAVRRRGQLTTPAITPAAHPIEVAVGPGPGATMLAYTSCTTVCRVVVSQLDGSAPQTVPGSAGASHPTISGDQVAWVRGRATVMTSTIQGAGRKVIAGAPTRKCYQHRSGGPRLCERPQNPRVDALALHGLQLALVAGFELNDGVGANGTVAEVRTESVKGGAQKLVALMDVGEGDEHYIGPSWARGRLFFYKICLGCDGGTFSFNPARNTYTLAKAHGLLAGFAIDQDGRRAFEATSDSPFGESSDLLCASNGCALTLTDPLAFTPVKSQARQP